MKLLRNFDKDTLSLYAELDTDMKAAFDRLHTTSLRISSSIKKGKWNNEDKSTYGTKDIFQKIVSKDSEYYYDHRLAWADRQASSYNLDKYDVYKLCPWIDSYFQQVYDYSLGYNDTIYRTSGIKSAIARNDMEWFKPSLQHIVPQSLGGPTNDIRNIMVMPLRANVLYRDMSPKERFRFLKVFQNKKWGRLVEQAEDLFYKKRI